MPRGLKGLTIKDTGIDQSSALEVAVWRGLAFCYGIGGDEALRYGQLGRLQDTGSIGIGGYTVSMPFLSIRILTARYDGPLLGTVLLLGLAEGGEELLHTGQDLDCLALALVLDSIFSYQVLKALDLLCNLGGVAQLAPFFESVYCAHAVGCCR